jgi:hypothetical protein
VAVEIAVFLFFLGLFVMWAVQKLVVATNFVTVYVSDHSAVPIPKRVFQGPNSQAEFVAFVRAHMRPDA